MCHSILAFEKPPGPSGVAAAAHSPRPQGCQMDTAFPTVTAAGTAAR